MGDVEGQAVLLADLEEDVAGGPGAGRVVIEGLVEGVESGAAELGALGAAAGGMVEELAELGVPRVGVDGAVEAPGRVGVGEEAVFGGDEEADDAGVSLEGVVVVGRARGGLVGRCLGGVELGFGAIGGFHREGVAAVGEGFEHEEVAGAAVVVGFEGIGRRGHADRNIFLESGVKEILECGRVGGLHAASSLGWVVCRLSRPLKTSSSTLGAAQE